MISVNEIEVKDILTKSKLPDADYVINPYTGCPHKCIYCYAEFMKRFTNHTECWGDFVDVKNCNKKINAKKISSKSVLIGSVTDAYNGFERKYEKTRNLLKQLAGTDTFVNILTKSSLVCRDIDILKSLKQIQVGISICTLEDELRKKIEPRASSISKRLEALEQLSQVGIKTYVFVGPIFPGITSIEQIVDKTEPFADFFCFENLNLRGAYKKRVLEFVDTYYPEHSNLYKDIYVNKNNEYWEQKICEIEQIFQNRNKPYKNYFFHEQIKK